MSQDWENIDDAASLLAAFTIDERRLATHTFHKDIFERLLVPSQLERVIVFLGTNETGLMKPVIFGQDANHYLLLPSAIKNATDDDDFVGADRSSGGHHSEEED